ncbi:MAG: NAD(P)-dependent alcohol dehydrogenase [Alphaproteobacteria bacterium]|nr:NAD(P)-dependent alcohol dehydrogenase [Alphaproteobacteria bacterium]
MRAFRLAAPTGFDALTPTELAIPKPGHRQVLVKLAAASLNHRDLSIALGRYRLPSKEQVIPLSDGAGTVVETGPGVTRVKTGDRVAGCFFQRWAGGEPREDNQAYALGGSLDGMLADYAVLEEDGVVPTPACLTDIEAATLPCAALTAWHALVAHGRLKAGETVLIQGTGGVSVFALQLARLMGATTIVTSSSDAKIAEATALGATHTINYAKEPAWEKAARAVSGGRGVDQVIEVGGAGTFAKSLEALRTGGHVSLIGFLAGAATVDPGLIMARRANVQGISVGSTEMFLAMNRAIAAGGLKPVVNKVFPFADAPAAYRYLQSAAHFGKVVIAFS